MTNYVNLIVNGYVNEYKYFTKYLLREQKKAEENHFDADEFFSKCLDVIESFKKNIEDKFNKRKSEIYFMRTLTPPLSDEMYKSSMDDNTLYNYSVTLFWATGREFTGHLFYKDVLYIEKKIKECQEKILLDNLVNPNLALEDTTIKNEDNPYPEVFSDYNSFKLFEYLHELNKDATNSLAIFSFIYRQMFKDEYLKQNIQKPEVFRKWLSGEPYFLDLDFKFKTLDNCRTDEKLIQYKIAVDWIFKKQ